MQKGFAFGKCIKNLLIAMVVLIPILCSLSCKAKLSFVTGDEIDIFDEVDKTHTTTITLYEENPAVNKSAKSVEKRYEIGTEVDAESFFKTNLKPGYRASSWIYYNPDDTSAKIPSNIHLEGDDIKSVYVTLRPLYFYADRWIFDSKVKYTVYHKLQNLDLETYADFEFEEKDGLPDTTIFAVDYKKEYVGFIFKEGTDCVITEDGKASVILYYDRKDVEITINSEKGTFTDDSAATSKTLTGKYGAKVTLPSMAKNHYEVAGFFVNGNDAEEIKNIETFPATNTSYTVHWKEIEKAQYKVHHKLQNENLKDYDVSETATYKDYPGVEINAEKFKKEYPGFTYKSSESGILSADGSTELSIYYDRIEVTITINSEKGTFVSDSNATSITLTGKYGTPVTSLPELKKEHYKLLGFVKDGTTSAVSIDTFPIENTSYTAKWVENDKVTYKVRHLLQKISSEKPESGREDKITSGGRTYYKYYEVAAETSDADYAGEMTKAEFADANLISNIGNYKAVGTSGGNPAGESAEITQQPISEDGSTVIDIYYDVKPFELTLNPNGGNGTAIKQTFYTETSCISIQSFASTMFEKQYHDFTGWNTKSDGSGAKYDDGIVMIFTSAPETPITLYATWEKNVAFGEIVLNFTPQDTTDISASVDTSVTGQVTITVVPNSIEVESYAWEVDGVRLSEESTNVLTIRESEYPAGYHTLICIVKAANGKLYVTSGDFTVRK